MSSQDLSVQEPCQGSNGAAHAAAGTGECAGALRLSAVAYLAAPRRLACQPQAGVSALSSWRDSRVRSKVRKKRVSALRPLLPAAQAPNEQWSMDFMSDSLANGQRFRLLTLVDNMSRESPAIEVDRSLTGQRVVAVLERLAARAGLPQILQVDNGPSSPPKRWTPGRIAAASSWRSVVPARRPIIPSSRPSTDASAQECLDQQWFYSLEEARDCLEEWRRDYNTIRPHTALGNQTPPPLSLPGMNSKQTEKPANLIGGPTLGGRPRSSLTFTGVGVNVGVKPQRNRLTYRWTYFGRDLAGAPSLWR